MELRCGSRLHGVIVDGLFEVKCRSKRCGAASSIIVFHYFDPITGELVKTSKFADPRELFEAKQKEKV